MKKTIIILSLILALALPVVAYGLTSDSQPAQNFRSFCGIGVDQSKLTEQQKADLKDSFDKMIEVRKDAIKKAIDNGSITKEQGDLALKRIEDMVKYHNENGTGFGPGMMGAGGRGSGMMRGNGMMGGPGMRGALNQQ